MEPVKNLTSHENLFNSRGKRTMRKKVSRLSKGYNSERRHHILKYEI
jgi:hypothetical protein